MDDLFIGHIVGFDAFAYGLKVAYKLLQSENWSSLSKSAMPAMLRASVNRLLMERPTKQLEAYALEMPEITNRSGRQEVLESIINRYLVKG